MPSEKEIKQALASVPRSRDKLAGSEMDTEGNVRDEESVVAAFKAERPLSLRDGAIYEVDVPAYESFSMPGDSSQTTKSLANDLVEADTVTEDVVAYQGGSKIEPDSVDYAANEITVTDDGTGNTLHVWYMAGDQAPVVIRKVSPGKTPETIDEDDMGLKNLRDQNKDPLRFDHDHAYQGVIPTDWEVEVRINAPYTVSWSEENGDAMPTNARISLPIFRARDEIPGLEGFIGAIAGRR